MQKEVVEETMGERVYSCLVVIIFANVLVLPEYFKVGDLMCGVSLPLEDKRRKCKYEAQSTNMQ